MVSLVVDNGDSFSLLLIRHLDDGVDFAIIMASHQLVFNHDKREKLTR
jgi:hypothetical protein